MATNQKISAPVFSLAASFRSGDANLAIGATHGRHQGDANLSINCTSGLRFNEGDANFRINTRNYKTNPIPQTNTLVRNSHPGLALPTAALHPGSTTSNSNTASGFHVCLYDFRVRSRCTGKERDAETGLDYFGFRYYSGAQGRWTSPDQPFADQHTEDPQSWNMYGYVRNNPLKNTDPDGRDCFGGWSSCWNYIVGGAKALANMAPDTVNTLAHATNSVLGTNYGDLPRFQASNADQAQGMQAANAVMLVSPVAEIAAPETVAATAEVPQIIRNAAQGKAFQNQLAADTAATDTNVVQNVMVKTQSGVRTQIDVVSTNPSGNIVLQEAKSSATAPLTSKQAAAHPEIAQTGATVVGAGKPPYVGGTQIPPTPVKVVRPNCPGGPGCPQ